MDHRTIGQLMSELYTANLRIYGSETLASVATAATIRRMMGLG
jgi:hypothetical protein